MSNVPIKAETGFIFSGQSAITPSASFWYSGGQNSNLFGGKTIAGIYVMGGGYLDATDTYKHSTQDTSAVQIAIIGRTTAGGIAFDFRTSQSYLHAADSAATMTSVLSVTHAGTIMVGSSSVNAAGSNSHRIYGHVSQYAQGVTGTNRDAVFTVVGQTTGNLTGVYTQIKTDQANRLAIFNATYGNGGITGAEFQLANVKVGGYDSSGSWQIGPDTPGLDAVSHTINGDTSNAAGTLFVKNFNTTNAAPAANFFTAATGTTTANKLINFIIAGGSTNGAIGVAAAGSVQFTTYSDRRLKENIVDLPPQLANILALRPVEFDYKKESPTGAGRSIGFIAQEVEEVYPDCVSYTGSETTEYKEVGGLSRTDARLIKAIQEQQQIIEQLKSRIDMLENK